MKKLFLLSLIAIIIVACGQSKDIPAEEQTQDQTRHLVPSADSIIKQQRQEFFAALPASVDKEELLNEEKNFADNIRFTYGDVRSRDSISYVMGEIENDADIATYKNLTFNVSYYSKSGKELNSFTEYVRRNIAPGRKVKFRINLRGYGSGIDRVELNLISASINKSVKHYSK